MLRRQRYESKGSEGEVEAMSNKLTANLKRVVVRVEAHPAFSTEWNEQISDLVKLARVIDMESRIEKGSSQQTLWEGEELILRSFIENGKLNVSLLMLAEFKKAQRIRRIVRTEETPEFDQRCSDFERSTCRILTRALAFVEVVQVLDISAFAEMIQNTLQYALENPQQVESFKSGGMLEEQSLSMIYLVLKHLEDLAEERVMRYIRKHKIMRLVVTAVASFAGTFNKDAVADALRLLSVIVLSDDFNVDSDPYVGSELESYPVFLPWSHLFQCIHEELQAMLKVNPKLRPEVYALRDFLRTVEWTTEESMESKLS